MHVVMILNWKQVDYLHTSNQDPYWISQQHIQRPKETTQENWTSSQIHEWTRSTYVATEIVYWGYGITKLQGHSKLHLEQKHREQKELNKKHLAN